MQLNCKATGNPAPEIRWTKDGVRIDDNVGQRPDYFNYYKVRLPWQCTIRSYNLNGHQIPWIHSSKDILAGKSLPTRRYAAPVNVETDQQPRAVSQKMTDGAILLIPVARHLLCCPSQNLHPKHIHRFEYDYEEGFIWKMDIDRCPPPPFRA